MRKILIIGAALEFAVAGCGRPPDYCEPGYEGGERFRITVMGFRDPRVTCDTSPLLPGDSFELTASNALMPTPDSDNNSCHIRAAVGAAPEFLRSVITDCISGKLQLGLECRGVDSTGCEMLVVLSVGPYIASGVQIIENGFLNLIWSGGCQAPVSCGGGEQYRVRIERLAPASP